MASTGMSSECSYCGKENICVEDEALDKFLLDKIHEILIPTSELSGYQQAIIFECGSDEVSVFELGDFIEMYVPIVNGTYLEGLLERLPNDTNDNGSSVLYALDDGNLEDLNDFENRWGGFINSIKHQKRFFNELALSFCNDLFSTIIDDDQILPSLVVDLPITQALYRARVAYSVRDIETIDEDPIRELGAVPAQLATSQRMTPAGVSAFYAAFDRNTCISELRPIVGDNVISGEFRPIRALKLLDLDALKDIQIDDDIFSDRWKMLSHAYTFFPELVFKLTRPSSRHNQHDYLTTQIIFEYLSTEFGSQIDGIIYPSIQTNGDSYSVALFPERSIANNGTISLENTDSFQENSAALFFVPESIRFHRVKGARYIATEEENSVMLTTGDTVLKRLFPRERY
ncbi:hypothetical protein BM528_13650 [Alteromonas sp. RW2A1]|uniref:RES domain-containing protein n=1 Tax=Alteromonas sp. RW2A1 TaxID=1917158 RepID=UPI0009032445|nr:RES domain-containing protein [Alteromonas sp. RW2A1]APE06685.1 hypothetical protein BM528_13650 [Alteromonas sp. RW2A1]